MDFSSLPNFTLDAKPSSEIFPVDLVFEEATTRFVYLKESFLPAMMKQYENHLFSRALSLLKSKKIGSHGRGRSGEVARDFVSQLKRVAGYNGRSLERPMAQYLEDLSVTRFPEGLSVLYLISGRGFTKSVVSTVEGALDLGIETVSLSYRENSPLAKCSSVNIYIPQKLQENFKSSRAERVRFAPIDVMGNSFETGADILSRSYVEGLIEYHNSGDLKSAAKASYDYINSAIDYVDYLNEKLYKIGKEIKEFGTALALTKHIRMVAAGEGATSLKIALNRICHSGRIGFGRTADFISSDDFGPPGYVDIKKNDAVIISSGSLRSSHAIAIAREASKAGADIYLITSDNPAKKPDEWLSEYNINEPKLVIALPYSLPQSEIRFYDRGVRFFLEYMTAGVMQFLGMSEKDAEWCHLQPQLE